MVGLEYRYLGLNILLKNQAKKNSKVQPWNLELEMFLVNLKCFSWTFNLFFFKKNIEFQKCTKNVPLKVLNYNHPKQLARYEHLMCSDSTSRRQSEPEFPEGHSVRHQLLWTFTILHLQYTTPVLRFFIPSQPSSVSSKKSKKNRHNTVCQHKGESLHLSSKHWIMTLLCGRHCKD